MGGGDDVGLWVVGDVAGDGVGESTGGVDGAVEDVDQCITDLLTTQVGPEDGGDVGVVDPLLLGSVSVRHLM